MKENWIEDVLVDLSKSALNEGRLELFSALNGFVKVASQERAIASQEGDKSGERISHNWTTAEVFDIAEYRYRKLMRQQNNFTK